MGILGEMDQNHRRDMQLYNSIFSLLCYEKIGFTGILRRIYFSPIDLSMFPPFPDQSRAFFPSVLPLRGAVQAVSHGRLHHSPVLRNATFHCSQPDLGAEGPR